MTGGPSPRCPVCGHAGWHERGGHGDGGIAAIECRFCGLVLDGAPSRAGLAPSIYAWLERGGSGRQGPGWSLSGPALRNAAFAFGFTLEPGRPERAWAAAHDVMLGILARGSALDAVATMVRALEASFARRIVLLDGDADQARRLADRLAGTAVAAHPLEGDFGAARNRLQAQAGGGWLLQLDTDERPSAGLLGCLGWVTACADADGIESLGLPRRNLVDGRLSALYPDLQYRLNRGHVRFEGRVHERPAVAFERTSLALAGSIEHRLTASRVGERTRQYAAMDRGAARPQDEARLRRPYDFTAPDEAPARR